eukprot:s3043_g1.t1
MSAAKPATKNQTAKLWLIVGSPRGRLRAALFHAAPAAAAACSLPLTVVSVDAYLRPAEEIPKLDSGAANMSHEDAVNWQRVVEDLEPNRFTKDDAGFVSPDEVVLIADDRVTGSKPLVEAAARIVVCSSSEAGCFQDCILGRVALQEYTSRIWPTHTRRAQRLLKWAQEARSLASKICILDEDEYRGYLSSEELKNFAADFFSRLCREKRLGEVESLKQKDASWWLSRVEGAAAWAPERTVRQLQQVRKNVISGFETAARKFAAQVTARLVRGSSQDAEIGLKELAACRLSQQAMSQEERARWSSVLCTREVGPGGEVLSVEVLRWAWARLKELQERPAAFSNSRPQMDHVLSINLAEEELIPFRSLLASDAEKLEPICLAVDMVLFFGRLHFLRQRMWDACPEETVELGLLLLEQKHWVLQGLGLRLVGQLLDADSPRFQVCFRDAALKLSLMPPPIGLTRALLALARPLETPQAPPEEGSDVEAIWNGSWWPARMRQHDPERGEILVEWTTGQVAGSSSRVKAGWSRRPGQRHGFDYWERLHSWPLVDGAALRRLLDRAPEHCATLMADETCLVSLRLLFHQALAAGCIPLFGQVAGALLRLLRYAATGSFGRLLADPGKLQDDLQTACRCLAALGSDLLLAESAALLTLVIWTLSQLRRQGKSLPDEGPALAPQEDIEEEAKPQEVEKTVFQKLPDALPKVDPTEHVLALRDLKQALEEEQRLRKSADEAAKAAERELAQSKETVAALEAERRRLIEQSRELEADLQALRSAAARREERGTHEATLAADLGEGDVAADDEADPALRADSPALTIEEAKAFLLRLAKRRDGVRALRPSLCGALRQLGESLYTSPVHFVDELLQNADDCAYPAEDDPSFTMSLSVTEARFSYNEVGFRACDVLSLCSLAVSTKKGGEFLGHKGVGFKSVFACSNSPAVISGLFRFQFEIPGMDELAYITPRWLERLPNGLEEPSRGTHILLPFRPELREDPGFLEQLTGAFEPLVLLGLRRLRRLLLESPNGQRTSAMLTKGAPDEFLGAVTWRAGLQVNDVEQVFRVLARKKDRSEDGQGNDLEVLLAFPAIPGPELPVCAGLPCARVGHRFLLQANWQLTTSREAVRECAHNYALRAEAAKLFAIAAQHPEVTSHLPMFLPAGGAATPPFWKIFAQEVVREVREVLPSCLSGLQSTAAGDLRLPHDQLLQLISAEDFRCSGIQVVEEKSVRSIL